MMGIVEAKGARRGMSSLQLGKEAIVQVAFEGMPWNRSSSVNWQLGWRLPFAGRVQQERHQHPSQGKKFRSSLLQQDISITSTQEAIEGIQVLTLDL